ncbi:hypothetical protein DFJ73DRAFT_838758 [Zopfochytrium polystomum]|nr:hypothetical protein DFJ73DRAFT_838758 [Zopfochytrium polystomum]
MPAEISPTPMVVDSPIHAAAAAASTTDGPVPSRRTGRRASLRPRNTPTPTLNDNATASVVSGPTAIMPIAEVKSDKKPTLKRLKTKSIKGVDKTGGLPLSPTSVASPTSPISPTSPSIMGPPPTSPRRRRSSAAAPKSKFRSASPEKAVETLPTPSTSVETIKAEEANVLWIVDRRTRAGQHEYLLVENGQSVEDASWHLRSHYAKPANLIKFDEFDAKAPKTLAPYTPTPGLLGSLWDRIYDSVVLVFRR